MPPRRKASGPAASARSQGTLSFSGVTKASKSAPVTSAKQNLIDTTSPKAKVKQDAVEIELAERTKDAEVETPEEEVKVPAIKSKKETKSKEILEAEKITDAKVKKYWKEEENKRKAPRVHQQGLTVHEKILRHFDLSSQFGPCIGIARTTRWQRANKLGLNPPIEVLAVLLKEENESGKGHMQKAYVDELMSSKTGVEAS